MSRVLPWHDLDASLGKRGRHFGFRPLGRCNCFTKQVFSSGGTEKAHVPGSPGCRWWFTPRKIHARVWPKTLYCHLLLACMAGKREAIFVFSRITMVKSALRWFLIVMRKMKALRVRVASLQLKLSRRGHGSSTRHHAPGWSG